VQAEEVAVTAGGEVHVHSGVYGCSAIVVAAPSIVSAFTRTGITAPVLNEKGWWPNTTSDC